MTIKKTISILIISVVLTPLQLPPYLISEALAEESISLPKDSAPAMNIPGKPAEVAAADQTRAQDVVNGKNMVAAKSGFGASSLPEEEGIEVQINDADIPIVVYYEEFPKGLSPPPPLPPVPPPPSEDGTLPPNIPPVITPLIFDGEGASKIDYVNLINTVNPTKLDGVAPPPPIVSPPPPSPSIGDPIFVLGPPGPSHPGPPVIAPLPPSEIPGSDVTLTTSEMED